MSDPARAYPAAESAVPSDAYLLDVADRVAAFTAPLLGVSNGWRELSEPHLWRELAACILGSQVTYEAAVNAIDRLADRDLLDVDNCKALCYRNRYTAQVAEALDGGSQGGQRRYRFPNRGASLLNAAANTLYGGGPDITRLLAESSDEQAARRLLVSRIAGIGPKQASLFLTSIGFATDVAVLDRHVLRFLAIVDPRKFAKPPRSLAHYEWMESELRGRAHAAGVSLATYDLSVWVVMRGVGRGAACLS